VSTSLVSITNDLHGFENRDWVVTSYLLTYTGLLSPFPTPFLLFFYSTFEETMVSNFTHVMDRIPGDLCKIQRYIWEQIYDAPCSVDLHCIFNSVWSCHWDC